MLFRVLFINAWMFCFSSVCLLCLMQPFIRLWVGEDYLLSGYILVIIVLNFYLEGMRSTHVTFKRAIGLFWQTCYKPVFEGVLNLAIIHPAGCPFWYCRDSDRHNHQHWLYDGSARAISSVSFLF